jgi:hypothetical protein
MQSTPDIKNPYPTTPGNSTRQDSGHSSPSPNKAHADGPKQNQKAGGYPLPASQHRPALITQKVLGQQLNQSSKNQQAGRDGVHRAD